MTPRRLPAFLLALVLVVAGCSSSREAARSNPAPPPQPEEAPPVEEERAPDDGPSDGMDPDAPEEDAAPAQSPQDWQHLDAAESGYAGIGTERAYAWLGSRAPADTVVVAVLDSGIDITHEDLDDVLWTNRGEVPGNDQDDDGNGYTDDVHGWNFLGGPDGRNVEHDTYELTRLYAGLRDEYEGADPDALSTEEQAEYERYQTLKAAFEEERQQLEAQMTQIENIRTFLDQGIPLVRSALGSDEPITLERLQTIGPGAGAQVQQAVQVFTNILQQTGLPNVAAFDEQVAQGEEQIGSRLEYGYNPDFDPRPIVGDDYDDVTERIYGNDDVRGPDASHGTGVASLIAAERDNGLGLRGVAGAVKIMPVRTVPGGDERDKDVANAIRYAVDNGADVINMSFGKGYSPRKDAVDAAVRYADEQGVLLVHAAGNDGVDLDVEDNFPSKYYAEEAGVAENWISVGASTAEGGQALAASFSNYGAERVDVFAPGAGVYAASPDDGYRRSDGTSFAAPVVSGVAALVMAYYPQLSATQVKDAILTSTTSYADALVQRPGAQGGTVSFSDLSATGGVVNAYEALRAAERMANE